MSDKENDDMRLRDQFAMQVMQAIIIANARLKNILINAPQYGQATNTEIYVGDFKYYLRELSEEMENISDFSYKMADMMRKSRLKSFT